MLVRTEIKGKKKPAEVPNVENAPNYYEQDSHETESNIDKVESIGISDIKATDCPEEFEHLDQEFEESMFAIHNHSPRTTDCTANILIQPGLLNVSHPPPPGSDGRDLIYGALTSEKKSSWGGAGDLRAGNKIDSSNIFNMEGSCFSGRQHDIGSGNFSNFASQVQVNDDAYDEFSAFIDRTIPLP